MYCRNRYRYLSRRSEGICDQYWMIVFQKAWRNGRKRVVGSGRRMDARDLERRCWGMGLSVWKMPVRYDLSGYWKLG